MLFRSDDVQDHAKEIDDLLAVAQHADAEVQRRAAGATFAGDPQPYKLDHVEDDDETDEDDD